MIYRNCELKKKNLNWWLCVHFLHPLFLVPHLEWVDSLLSGFQLCLADGRHQDIKAWQVSKVGIFIFFNSLLSIQRKQSSPYHFPQDTLPFSVLSYTLNHTFVSINSRFTNFFPNNPDRWVICFLMGSDWFKKPPRTSITWDSSPVPNR